MNKEEELRLKVIWLEKELEVIKGNLDTVMNVVDNNAKVTLESLEKLAYKKGV